MRTILLSLMALSVLVGCGRPSPLAPGTPAARSPQPPAEGTPIVVKIPASPTPGSLQALEEAIRRGDWAAARAAYEAAGAPPLPAERLNAWMEQALREIVRAQKEGQPERGERIRADALALVGRGCRCLDPQGSLRPDTAPAGLRVEWVLALSLAGRPGGAALGGTEPLPEWGRKWIAARFGREPSAIPPLVDAQICSIADHLFLIVGFYILQLDGPFHGEAPGLSALSERERDPERYYVLCEADRIQWVNAMSGGEGTALEAEWDGKGFRSMGVERANPAADTYQEVRRHVEAGELEEALRAYEEGAFTRQVDEDPELATEALRQGLAVAQRRAEAGDAAGAARALHAALTLASLPYELEGPTFLPQDWAIRPRSLEEWAREAFYGPSLDPALYREALAHYARYLARSGQAREAEPILRGLIVLSPDYAPAYLDLGDALWDLGKQEEAREFYRRYLALRPGEEPPPRVRERLGP